MPTRALAALTADLIDYAGLFPPAKLGMAQAVVNYARDRMGEHAAMLGRFVCPAARLREFSEEACALMPGTFATAGYREMADAGSPWAVSALVDGESRRTLQADLAMIEAFNQHHATEDHGMARVDMIEIKTPGVEAIDPAVEIIPDDLFPFFEVPAGLADPRGFVAALPGHAAGAKLRAGGVTADAFPSSERVAAFLTACASVDVPFKATAGLHHPIRGPAKLTDEPGAPSCVMHGFVNLFIAAALAYTQKADAATIQAVLDETDPRAFVITDDGASCRRQVLSVTDVVRTREAFALSFGSCSFDEPIADLKALGLL